MAFHDLNVAYHNEASLSQTLPFLQELGYSVVALAVNVSGKLPSPLPTVAVNSTLNASYKSLTILKRLTLTISDTSQNHRINTLNAAYDLVALRPTNDKAFQLCCSALDCDIISLDFTQRIPFPIKFKTVASALQRGIRFEICYSGGITGSNDARRNLISGAGALIRATRGRGIILSSEARTALGLRAPWDVVNLATVWGLSQERGKEAICEEAARVVRLAGIKRTSFRGVVDVIEDGTRDFPVEVKKAQQQLKESVSVAPQETSTEEELNDQPASTLSTAASTLKQVTVVPDKTPNQEKAKRKASTISLNDKGLEPNGKSNDKPLSKREMKRQAKKARFERVAAAAEDEDDKPEILPTAPKQTKDSNKNGGGSRNLPVQHETLSVKKKKG